MNCRPTQADTELYHHGVKGMKWGVRRQEKIRAEKRGEKSSLRKMTDAERVRYAQGRVEVMGGRRKAALSDTANMIGKTLKTTALGVGGALAGGVSGFTSVAAISSLAGTSPIVASIVATEMAMIGAATPAAIATSALAVKGGRYVKNLLAIKNTGKKDR